MSAHIGLSEEFGVETVINEIKNTTETKDLYLLLNSPGGLVQSSYKVARALRKNFEHIVVFVPHIAASGGTLVALIGNEIVMGMMSQLSPIDPQTEINDYEISGTSMVRSFEFVTEFFKDTSPDDAPYTYKVLAEKFHPVQIDECLSICALMEDYTCEILIGAGYEEKKAKDIAKKLVSGFLIHEQVINFDRAKEIGLNVKENIEYPTEWNSFRKWLGKYMLKSADKHIIRYVLPEGEEVK